MGNAAEGCCGLRSPDQVRDNNGSNVSNEDRRRNFIVRRVVLLLFFIEIVANAFVTLADRQNRQKRQNGQKEHAHTGSNQGDIEE